VAAKALEGAGFGLTRIHNIYLQACIKSKMYRQGLKIA